MEDALYRDLFASAPDGIVIVDVAGRITMVNKQAEAMFGFAESELVGRPVEVLVPARFRSVHTLQRSGYIDRPRTRPMGAGIQLSARRKDGSEFPVEISLSPVETRDATLIAAVVRDITERRRSEDAIRAQAQLLDLAQDAIVVLNRDRQIQYWNYGAEYTYGWTAEEAMGQRMEDLLQTSFPRPVEQMLQELAASGSWEGEVEHTTQDGRRIAVASRMVVQRAPDGAISTIMEINRDITERRQLERERERLLLESQRQRDRERIGMDLHDGIIQSIYAVSLGLEAAAEDVHRDQDEALKGINAAIDHLSDTIRDIRSYIFGLKPSRYSADLADSFREMVLEFEQGAAMRVNARIDDDVPDLSEDERNMLFHIAREALANAQKHAQASCVSVELRKDASSVWLSVVDDGIGFPPEIEPSNDQHGLRNMRQRAATIGAELELRSQPGHGTAIVVTVPVAAREGA